MALNGTQTALLNKIARNLTQLGIANTLTGTTVVASGLTISYNPASIQAPMGGVDPTVSPFLGLGVVMPGQITITGAPGQNTLASIMTSDTVMNIVRVCCGPANDVLIYGNNGTLLSTMPGTADWNMMGQ